MLQTSRQPAPGSLWRWLLWIVPLLFMPAVVQAEVETKHVVIVLRDFSESMKQQVDTTQALVLHYLSVLGLSHDQTRVVVIQFGGESDVSLLADDKGEPTAAIGKLRHQVLAEWKKAHGATPMVAALEKARSIVQKQSPGTRITTLLISDGQPDSGFLDPQTYPEVKQAIDNQFKRLTNTVKLDPNSPFAQKALQALQRSLAEPTSPEFRDLYERIQLPAEFKKAVSLITDLAKSGPRWVTVDFAGGQEALRKLHQAAGGTQQDYVVCRPDNVIAQLRNLGLTSLPGVIEQTPLDYTAIPASFQSEIPLQLDASLAQQAVVSVVMHPPISEWEQHAKLTALVGGQEIVFSTNPDHSDRSLISDSHGNIALAEMTLDKLPADGRFVLRFESSDKMLHPPAMTVYIHSRLSDGLRADFRPIDSEPAAMPPFRISPNRAAEFSFALLKADGTVIPLQSVDPLLQATSSELRVSMEADPQRVDRFRSPGKRVPAGTYDVALHLVTKHGAHLTFRLPRHLESVAREVVATVDISSVSGHSPQVGESLSATHMDFGQLGDEVVSRSISITVRSSEMDHSLLLIPHLSLSDAAGSSLNENWARFDSTPFELSPNRPAKLRITLQVPKSVEESIVDGLVAGQLDLLDAETRQPIRLKRLGSISGASDDTPVQRVTFQLKRPAFSLRSSWTWRQQIRDQNDQLELRINHAIGQPLFRDIELSVSHDSKQPRSTTVISSALINDSQGAEIPGIHLLPITEQLTEEIGPHTQHRWKFRLVIDQQSQFSQALTHIDVTAPGVRTTHLTILVQRRSSLLNAAIRTWSLFCAIVLGLLALWSWRAARLQGRMKTGRTLQITSERGLSDVLQIEPAEDGIRITPEVDLLVSGLAGQQKSKRVRADTPFNLKSEDLDRQVEMSVIKDEDQPEQVFRIVDAVRAADGKATSLLIEVDSNPEGDASAQRWSFKAGLYALLAGLAVLLMLYCESPGVIAMAQWTFDLLFSWS